MKTFKNKILVTVLPIVLGITSLTAQSTDSSRLNNNNTNRTVNPTGQDTNNNRNQGTFQENENRNSNINQGDNPMNQNNPNKNEKGTNPQTVNNNQGMYNTGETRRNEDSRAGVIVTNAANTDDNGPGTGMNDGQMDGPRNWAWLGLLGLVGLFGLRKRQQVQHAETKQPITPTVYPTV